MRKFPLIIIIKMCIAIANTFNYKYAFMILESYIIAFVKHMECFYLIDPHAQWRNYYGLRPGEPGGSKPQWAKMGAPRLRL
jgi:hypothetical protein